MGMQTYGMYEAVVPKVKLKEVAPVEYANLYDFMEEHEIEEWDMQILWADGDVTCILGTESTDEEWSKLSELTESFRTEIGEKAKINIYPIRIDSDAMSESAGEVLWASEFELSEKLQAVDAYVEAWTEMG